jgi:uncharacterized surface protein with fasciclin (FAS1) repeats
MTTTHINKRNALFLSTALLVGAATAIVAAPSTTRAAAIVAATPAPSMSAVQPMVAKKCDVPGAIRRANNSRFICSPEGARNVWRRLTGASITAVAKALPNYSLFVAAVTAAGLDTTLASPGSYTVFAPRNAAFLSLPPGVLDTLLKPENVAALRQVLLHHVVNGTVKAADVSTGSYQMLDGTSVNVRVLKNNRIFIGEARVVLGDVLANNGVIHGINAVLLPPGFILPS